MSINVLKADEANVLEVFYYSSVEIQIPYFCLFIKLCLTLIQSQMYIKLAVN